ncbi:MAG: stage III sporulation protein AF [Bacillota bacterium]
MGRWVKEIAYLTIFASFVTLLIPESSYRKYARLVLATLILVTVLRPAIGLLRGQDLAGLSARMPAEESFAMEGPAQDLSRMFEELLNERVKALVVSLPGVASAWVSAQVKVESTGAWEVLRVRVEIRREISPIRPVSVTGAGDTVTDADLAQQVYELLEQRLGIGKSMVDLAILK